MSCWRLHRRAAGRETIKDCCKHGSHARAPIQNKTSESQVRCRQPWPWNAERERKNGGWRRRFPSSGGGLPVCFGDATRNSPITKEGLRRCGHGSLGTCQLESQSGSSRGGFDSQHGPAWPSMGMEASWKKGGGFFGRLRFLDWSVANLRNTPAGVGPCRRWTIRRTWLGGAWRAWRAWAAVAGLGSLWAPTTGRLETGADPCHAQFHLES